MVKKFILTHQSLSWHMQQTTVKDYGLIWTTQSANLVPCEKWSLKTANLIPQKAESSKNKMTYIWSALLRHMSNMHQRVYQQHPTLSVIHESGHTAAKFSVGKSFKAAKPCPNKINNNKWKQSKLQIGMSNNSKHEDGRMFISKSRTLTPFGSKQLSATYHTHTLHSTILLAWEKWQVPCDFCTVEHWCYHVFHYHVYRLWWLGTQKGQAGLVL